MNRVMAGFVFAGAGALLLQPTSPSAGSPRQEAHPDLTGNWAFSVKLSDNPLLNVREMLRHARRGGGGAGMSSAGTSGSLPGGGGRSGPSQEVFEIATRPAVRILINQKSSSISIMTGRRRLAATTDGAKMAYKDAKGRKVELKAEWKDGALHVERKVNHGPKIKEVYNLADGGGRLEIQVDLKQKGMKQSLKLLRVYERTTAE